MAILTPTPGQPVPAAAAGRPAAGARLLFVDNIRVFLTVLVIAHHLLITYAGSGSWYYQEEPQDFAVIAIGSWFASVNQAFFMGLFLFIAGYFVPAAYDRKGAGRFVKDRLIRLGIPLAIYSWIISPLFVYLLRRTNQGLTTPFWSFFPGEYFGSDPVVGAGPLWFIETLLIFSLAYVAWRLIRPGAAIRPPAARFPGYGAVALFALLLGIATFLVRLVFPVGWSFGPLNLQFPHFAQYIALFVAGLVASGRGWLATLSDRAGRTWLAIACFLILMFVPMALVLDAGSNSELFQGGPYPHALIYAIWENTLCVALCIGLVRLFRQHANSQGPSSAFLARNAYTAFIIHAPVITFLALGLQNVSLHPLLKFVLLVVASVPLMFLLSSLVRRLPYADRIL